MPISETESAASLKLLVAIAKADGTLAPEERAVFEEAFKGAKLPGGVTAQGLLDGTYDAAALARQILRGRPPLQGQSPGRVQDVEILDDFLAANSIGAVLQPIVALQEGGNPAPLFGLESLARAPRESILKNPEILFELIEKRLRKELVRRQRWWGGVGHFPLRKRHGRVLSLDGISNLIVGEPERKLALEAGFNSSRYVERAKWPRRLRG